LWLLRLQNLDPLKQIKILLLQLLDLFHESGNRCIVAGAGILRPNGG
jgi:hypothetical protein